ncbi:hypothetical protein [Pedobacter sp.]|uniref:hypothetical protein n=1 Tax=Pedobacter sp. TaxID=1411316 RepID=UPI003BA969BC
MKRIIIAIFILSFPIFSCTTRIHKLKFITLKQFDYAKEIEGKFGSKDSMRGVHYVVQNYQSKNKSEHQIDSFVNTFISKIPKGIMHYNLVFYKESSKTNVKHLKVHPRDLVRYSQDNDLIYIYYWNMNRPLIRNIWENGEIIEPKSDVIVEEP